MNYRQDSEQIQVDCHANREKRRMLLVAVFSEPSAMMSTTAGQHQNQGGIFLSNVSALTNCMISLDDI
jgi:hypothetical protein